MIQLLQRKGGVTVETLALEMNVHKRTVYRYIQEVSVVLPVWETRDQPKRFRLLED